MSRLLKPLAFLALIAAFAWVVPLPQSALSQQSKKPEIHSDLSVLPERVRDMRTAILEAARAGDVEAMRPVLEMNELLPTVTFGGSDDPIAFWKKVSGDGEGREVLAALVEVLEMPFARTNAGTPEEMYIWPYLAQLPPKDLTPAQKVDLFQLVSPKEAKTMEEFGDYIHYRLGIGRDGTWHFFVAGD
ncbi:MAG: hypothetical protein MPJ78_13335 [Hyphomicrobiaceae bacterium]|nr:hypothetical protein [Hyphomicrobiaceae bacterium]